VLAPEPVPPLGDDACGAVPQGPEPLAFGDDGASAASCATLYELPSDDRRGCRARLWRAHDDGDDACAVLPLPELPHVDADDESPPLLRRAPDGDDAVTERRVPCALCACGASERELTSWIDADDALLQLEPLCSFLLARLLREYLSRKGRCV